MNKSENNVTLNVTLMSQIQSCFCDINATKIAVINVIISNISVTLRNMRGMASK